MKATTNYTSDTNLELTLVADKAMLQQVKQQVLLQLQKRTRVQGFRQGKAPLPMVERAVDPNTLGSQFLEQAINQLYSASVVENKLRPVTQPRVSVEKFVPFDTLEVKATVEVVGKVTVPDYKKIKLAKTPVSITKKDVDEVVEALQTRQAERKQVERAAKANDEVTIDFKGIDAETKEDVNGAEGKSYPLVLGSDSFIPGFEKNVIGMKPEETKDFTITFPKDYGVKALQNRKVTFTVTVHKVNELVQPKADDAFAAKAGPFKDMKELRASIEQQLTSERQQKADRDYESELLEKISDKSTAAIPAALIDEEVERMERDERQNIVYRGQTWQEHLDAEGKTEQQHRDEQKPAAEKRVKAGLVLAEIAEKEGIDVTKEDIDMRLQLLKGQYTDKSMQAELDKPETRRDIAGRMVTEKTIEKLVAYASK